MQQVDRGVGDHGARREDRGSASGVQRVEVAGGITPPTTIMMSGRPTSCSASRNAGTSVR
ncbi:methylmalonyl-CoA mutase-like domain protein [Mycobacterium xenopi 3993]|nr:methylmalonyl-CoA mutase-like domain protein [Mycobacterium xenopi 3993]